MHNISGILRENHFKKFMQRGYLAYSYLSFHLKNPGFINFVTICAFFVKNLVKINHYLIFGLFHWVLCFSQIIRNTRISEKENFREKAITKMILPLLTNTEKTYYNVSLFMDRNDCFYTSTVYGKSHTLTHYLLRKQTKKN